MAYDAINKAQGESGHHQRQKRIDHLTPASTLGRRKHRGEADRALSAGLPGLWSPTLLDQPDAQFTPIERFPDAIDWPSFLWQLTGGLPRQLARLRAEVMDSCLLFKDQIVTSDLVLKVFDLSPSFAIAKDRIRALVDQDVPALRGFVDLPVDLLRKHWSKGSESRTREPGPARPAPQESGSASKKVPSTVKCNKQPDEKNMLCDGLKAATKQAQDRKSRGRGSAGERDIDGEH